MTRWRISWTFGLLAMLSLPAFAGETTADYRKSQRTPCITGAPVPYGVTGWSGTQPVGGCIDPNCTHCNPGESTWWTRTRDDWGEKSRGLRRWWYRQGQSKKGLQHPAVAPLHHPNWGYHPTCWRRFPPICRPCPPANGGYQIQPVPPANTPPAIPPALDKKDKPTSSTGASPRVFPYDMKIQPIGYERTSG